MLDGYRVKARRIGRFASMSVLALVLSILVAACSRSKQSAATVTVQPAPRTTATSVPTPTSTPDPSPLAEFVMPRFNVSGKVVVMGVDPNTNTMESPTNKDDVAYYDFTPKPGSACKASDSCANTVLSGHVDWYTGQVGVFWHLRDLKEGDELQLKLQDGKVYSYKVSSNQIYGSDAAPVEQIVGDTPQPSLTLITCDGVFNKSLQEYNNRRVVRALLQS